MSLHVLPSRIKKTEIGFTIKDQYFVVNRRDGGALGSDRNECKIPIRYDPQFLDFNVTLGKRESLEKTKEDPHVTEDEEKKFQKQIPFYSRWFSLQKIHKLERDNLPEFFGEKPSKTPKLYMKIRNFIIKLYWRNPRTYLTATSCRRCISGDICAILRIHAFLEHWGLININHSLETVNTINQLTQNLHFPVVEHSKENKGTERRLTITNFNEKGLRNEACNKLFKLLKMDKPRCYHCEKNCNTVWFENIQIHTFLEHNDENNTNRIIICQKCYLAGKLPIFLSEKDFKMKTISSLKTEQTESVEWSIEDRTRLFKYVKECYNGYKIDLEKLKELMNDKTEEEILRNIVRFCFEREDLITQNNVHNELTYQRNIHSKIENKLSELDYLLSSDNYINVNDSIKSLKRKKQKIQSNTKAIENVIDEQMEHLLEKKFDYLGKLEKILVFHNKIIKRD